MSEVRCKLRRYGSCEESGLASLRHGQRELGSIARILGVSDVAVLNWVRDEARKLPEPSTKAEVVVVTLDEMWRFVKKGSEKLWLWRAYDPIARRTIAWVLGRRDDAACQKLLNKIGLEGKTFVTDDWEGYHRLIPEFLCLRCYGVADLPQVWKYIVRGSIRQPVFFSTIDTAPNASSEWPPSSKKLSVALTFSTLRRSRQISAMSVSTPAAGGTLSCTTRLQCK